MILNERELLERLDAARRVVLIEPPYRRKYPPLALAKMAGYLRARGTPFEFVRSYAGQRADLVLVTSVFTSDFATVLGALRRVRYIDPALPLVVGGVAASLFAKGLSARGFDVFEGYSRALDVVRPAYDVDWQIDPDWRRFSFTFTTRGCPAACRYCVVSRLEPGAWVNPEWRAAMFGDRKPCVVVNDNNLLSAPRDHVREVLTEIASRRTPVYIDSGLDSKLVDEEIATLLARVEFTKTGARLAFDRISEDGIFQEAALLLQRCGVPSAQMMALVLYNFTDTPQEADYRMRECSKVGVRPYGQRFIPLNARDRVNQYVGKWWTPRLLHEFRYFWNQPGAWRSHSFADWITFGKSRLAPEDVAAFERGAEEWNAKR